MSLLTAQSLLVEAADPQASLPAEASNSADTLKALLDAAEMHGVRPILLRKLRRQPGPQAATVLPDWNARSIIEAGQSLLLRRQAEQVLAAFRAEAIPARVVKGPVFADRLYPHPADRPFTDIDLLLRREDIAKAGPVMTGLGYGLPMGEEHSAGLLEYKWQLADNPSVMVEVHADLVHLPNLRRRLSLGFERLQSIDAGEADSPASLLLIAVVHAAGGHKFHRLQLLVDVLQAVRGLHSEMEEERALEAARQCGASLEFSTVVDITGRVFGEDRAKSLGQRAASGLPSRVARSLITPRAMLDAGTSWQSRLRRDAFRWVQRLARA